MSDSSSTSSSSQQSPASALVAPQQIDAQIEEQELEALQPQLEQLQSNQSVLSDSSPQPTPEVANQTGGPLEKAASVLEDSDDYNFDSVELQPINNFEDCRDLLNEIVKCLSSTRLSEIVGHQPDRMEHFVFTMNQAKLLLKQLASSVKLEVKMDDNEDDLDNVEVDIDDGDIDNDDDNDDADMDGSLVDDSDDESLCNKLCTFTLTQKEFVNQHWYHCHTCNMIDRVGVCTICAKVCHKDHDISYSKYGAFFCDCAGRENGSCMALVKRSSSVSDELNRDSSGQNMRDESQQEKNRSDVMGSSDSSHDKNVDFKKMNLLQQKFSKQLDIPKDDLTNMLSQSNICATIMDLLSDLIPAYVQFAQDESHIGRNTRARAALEKLHTAKKSFLTTEALMLPTLGSQEGAFENVRVNYTGEHASLIKQLITNNSLRRVAITSLSSPLGKRQHLVVCHERGKITLLQLNALLRQADSSKRKLTLTRLASAPVPFSVISITANQFNEDVLAVCGLRDCHVLTFTQNGLVSSHIELNVDLSSASDHIIKAVWVPGSQTEVAVLTSEVIKIFDLSEESSTPKHHLKLAFGQIKDVTFIVPEVSKVKYIIIMNTAGHIFRQELDGRTLSSHGLFYVTAELQHEHIKEKDGRINGGGVSLYFSHSFKILFFSYADGNYMASMPNYNEIRQVFPLEFELSQNISQSSSASYTSMASSGNEKAEEQKSPEPTAASAIQPLCQWSEVPGHAGIIMAFCQNSNNPVILMLNPDCIMAQEIRYLTIKSKITDATAIRHTTSSGEARTTLILLCEDGSLRIYMASQDLTDYWLKLWPIPGPAVSFGQFTSKGKASKRRKSSKSSKKNLSSTSSCFSVDFFENLQQMNDIDFGGNDVLSVYSVQQLKSRLNSSGMHVTCPKRDGFSIDVINNDSNMVVCGVRVQVGVHDLTKSPTSIEIFGRTISISPATARWYDVPFTRDESVQSEKRFTISFGPSADTNNLTTVDSIKVYGKTKDSFLWPDDGEDTLNSPNVNNDDLIGVLLSREIGSRFQKLITYSVESLECLLHLTQYGATNRSQLEGLARELSTSLLTIPYPPQVLKVIKNFLMTIYCNRQNYNYQKDLIALEFVTNSLASFKQGELDCELYSRIVHIMRSLCQTKLSNFTKLSESLIAILNEKDLSLKIRLTTESSKLEYIIQYLHEFFQHLHSQRPNNLSLASISSSGLINYEDTLQPLIELMYSAMLHDFSISPAVTNILIGYILNEDLKISSCARHTLIRLLRLKSSPQTEMCETDVQQHNCDQNVAFDLRQTCQMLRTEDERPHITSGELQVSQSDRYESIPELPGSTMGSQHSSIASQLRNVFRDQIEVGRQDDEDIAIAIALSLQDDSQNNSVTDNAVTAAPTTSGRSELNFLSDRMPSAEELMSDTTASGVASDEEISTSGPRPASIPKPASASHIDCTQSTSGMIETGNNSNLVPGVQTAADIPALKPRISTSSSKLIEQERMKQLHLIILQRLIEHLPDTREAGGYRSISLLHVILVLTLDLDCESEIESTIFKNLLCALQNELLINTQHTTLLVKRSPINEVKLVIMRMFSILMSKVRTSTVSCSTKAETSSCWSIHCSTITASSLIESDVLGFCFKVLEHLTDYWRNMAENLKTAPNSSSIDTIIPINKKTLPKSAVQSQLPDLSPFFQRSQVKGHADLFEDYTQLLTEMVLRIPYQIKKVSSSSSNNLKSLLFTNEWPTILCEYLMIAIPSFIKKHVRKLLTFICGSKDSYRQLRDFHFLESHMKSIKSTFGIKEKDQNTPDGDEEIKGVILNYESMSSLVEHLKSCIEIAQDRCINWQIYCLLKDQDLLCNLIKMSMAFGEDVSPIILELLQHALSSPQLKSSHNLNSFLDTTTISANSSELINDQTFRDTLTSESLSADLSQQLITSISRNLLSRFIQIFLLETNTTSLRWQAHGLIYNLWSNFSPTQQQELLSIFWSLWSNLPKYGRKASQFVDLIGFMTLKSPECDDECNQDFCQETLTVLRQQNALLLNHPNAHIYSSIQGLVDLDSYYLESEPCSVCNSPEIPYSNLKLSSIKVDSRFTTTTQIIKLIGSHTILKFTIRISDVKRSKLVKAISIYYNNRSVQSVVELKNKTGIWSLARKKTISPGLNEVKIEFTLPIVACNLMIEFSDFYENFQASSETLQCPRCSTSVSANPGVCSNCGENVFQCHKCRAINYDEKDPFLCISCGFCKYARFDISLTAKPTCAVDPIENEDDRKKTMNSISNLLEKADRVYKNLMLNKPTLELLLLRIHEQVLTR